MERARPGKNTTNIVPTYQKRYIFLFAMPPFDSAHRIAMRHLAVLLCVFSGEILKRWPKTLVKSSLLPWTLAFTAVAQINPSNKSHTP